MFTENHKILIKQIIMEDFDLRPSIAQVILNCLIESCIKIKSEDIVKEKVTDTVVYSNTVANNRSN